MAKIESINIGNGSFKKGLCEKLTLNQFKKMFPKFNDDYEKAFIKLGGKKKE